MPIAFELTCPATLGAEPQDLIARLLAGEVSALGEAYDLHHMQVRAFARRLVGDDAIAEEVVQETFVLLPRAIHGYAGGAPLRTFLIGIAVNHARHHVRAATRRRAAMRRFASEPALACEGNPEMDVQGLELASALTRALDSLPLDQRVAFVLCELEQCTSVEAGLVLDVPDATVRTRLHHAKRKLRAWFERRGIR